jgi:hypothetical protein
MTTAVVIVLALLALLESVHHHINMPHHWSKRT